MDASYRVIHDFYSAFQRKDYRAMQDAYGVNSTFTDPVFGTLRSEEVKAMWEMLIKRAPDLNIDFKSVLHDIQRIYNLIGEPKDE